jgi:biopolymer transport protein ExbD
MPKIKLPRSSPSIDMTPMVDLAFLLVTFFILTTKFRPDEAVKVTIPFSVSSTKLPENVTTIDIDSNGRVFIDMDVKDVRASIFQSMADKYKSVAPGIGGNEVARFAVCGPFGAPMAKMKEYLDDDDDARKDFNKASPGIPHDTTKPGGNELADWIHYAYANVIQDYNQKVSSGLKGIEQPRFAIKADGHTKYKDIKTVVDICQKQNIQHFELITSLKAKPQ